MILLPPPPPAGGVVWGTALDAGVADKVVSENSTSAELRVRLFAISSALGVCESAGHVFFLFWIDDRAGILGGLSPGREYREVRAAS